MHPWKSLRGLPKEIWIITISTLINRMGTMVLPFLVIYLTSKIGLNTGSAGFVFTIYGLGGLFTAPYSGRLSDKIGAFRLIKFSLFFSGIFLLLYPIFTTYISILVITLLWSIITEAVRPASLSLISTIVPIEKRKTAFALNRLMINLGMSIGPVVAGFLIKYSFSLIFYIDAATSILAALFLLLFPINAKISKEKSNDLIEHELNRVKYNPIKDKSLIYFLVSLLPISMVIFQFYGVLPLYLVKDLGFATSTVGMIFAVNTVLIIFVEVLLNNAMSGWQENKSLALGAVLLGIGFGATAFSSNIFSVVMTVIIWTFGEMIVFPSSAAYVAEIAPGEKRGECMGYLQMTYSLAITLGPWLGTKVYETYDAGTLWISTFFVGLISAIMMWNIKKQKRVLS